MKKTIKREITKNKIMKCPICDYENDFRFGNTCEHVDRVTAQSKVIYRIPIYKTRYNDKFHTQENINLR